ncbi:MAG: GNAT family N-acetyltransferase [Cephaloticoccus sp.]|nr:GNAT family N-acetyltransferase [Cephaloticoccus sp.]MCF7759502.1 GNAT family N-acetyltransferase [Cephaloticoccus sp.]
MTLEFSTVKAFGLPEAAELLTHAFADYLVTIKFNAEMLQQMVPADSLDLDRSLVVHREGEPAGIILLARRNDRCRVAGMAVVPAARRLGVGRAMMERVINDARRRGDRAMVLEVIEQNGAAVRLYEKLGFTKVRRLVGFAGSPPSADAPVTDLTGVDLPVFAAMLSAHEPPDWPWQLSGQTVAQSSSPGVGYALAGAWIWLLNPAGPVVVVRAMAVEGEVNRTGRAEQLLRAVMARHPAPKWHVGAIWPEECADWFDAVGLERQEITQWQMKLAL